MKKLSLLYGPIAAESRINRLGAKIETGIESPKDLEREVYEVEKVKETLIE